MTKRLEVYKCSVSGDTVEVVHASTGTLVCCGKPMELLAEKKEDQGREKHLPVIEKAAGGVKVKVGEIPHPMEEKHYIEWIEVITEKGTYIKFLKPGEKPEAEFAVNEKIIAAREFCTVHGLWKRDAD